MGVFVYDGTKNGLAKSLIPDTHTLPSPSTFDPEVSTYTKKGVIFPVTKSGVENVDPGVTMDNIFSQLDTDIDAFIDADVDPTTNNINAHAVVRSITSNFTPSEEFLTDVATVYYCFVDYFTLVS